MYNYVISMYIYYIINIFFIFTLSEKIDVKDEQWVKGSNKI